MNAQTADGTLLDEHGQEILYPIASDVNGTRLEASQGLRRFLMGMRDAIEHDDKHFREETFADIFAFYETAKIGLDTTSGEGHHFDDAYHTAMSAFSMVSVGAAFYLLNSFSEQRGKKEIELRRALKMYTEFESDRANEEYGETPEERRTKALENLAYKMKHSGLQFVNLPIRDLAFPHDEFQKMADDRGIGQPVLMSTINNVRNFTTSSEHRIEMTMNASNMLSFRVSQLGKAIKRGHNKLQEKINQSDTIGAFRNALGHKAPYIDQFGRLKPTVQQENKDTVSESVEEKASAFDKIEDKVVETVYGGGKILLQYIENAVRSRRIPGIVIEGVKEAKGLSQDLKGKKTLEAEPDIKYLNLFRYAVGKQALPEDMEEQIAAMDDEELESLRDNTLEILKDIEGHTIGAKRARTSFIVQATFAGAQIMVGSLKALKAVQNQEPDPTIAMNVYSFYASMGPLFGFKNEMKRERGFIRSKDANIAESLMEKLKITEKDVDQVEFPEVIEEPPPEANADLNQPEA